MNIARGLAAGYPSEKPEKLQQGFLKVLEVMLPALSQKALAAWQEGKTSVEDVWKAIRGGATVILLTPEGELLWRRSGLFRREELEDILRR